MNASTCPSTTPYVVVIVIMFLLLIPLVVWMIYQLFKPKTTCPPAKACPAVSTPAPVYLYGFGPGGSTRELSNTTGVMTLAGDQVRALPLNKANLGAQQWRLIEEGDKVLLQNGQRYLNSNLQPVTDVAQAVRLSLDGPSRNGRIYRLRNGKDYLITEEDSSIKLRDPGKAVPLNGEWIIALGTCQSAGDELCRH